MWIGVGAGASTLKTARSTIVDPREELVGIADAEMLPRSKARREMEEYILAMKSVGP